MPKVRTLQNTELSQKPQALEKTDDDEDFAADDEQQNSITCGTPALPNNKAGRALGTGEGFTEPVKKQKRNLTEEHKKILTERLAKAREIKKQQANQKLEFENKIRQEKEKEAEAKLIKKVKQISRQKERDIILKYLSESDEEEPNQIIVKKQSRAEPKQKPNVTLEPKQKPNVTFLRDTRTPELNEGKVYPKQEPIIERNIYY